MSIILETYKKFDIRQHNCKLCKSVLMESGCFRMEGVKEIRMVGSWQRANTHVRYLYHPADALLHISKRRIISIDVFCKCDRCGTDNQFIVSTILNNPKGGIKVQYNRLSGGQGKLHI